MMLASQGSMIGSRNSSKNIPYRNDLSQLGSPMQIQKPIFDDAASHSQMSKHSRQGVEGKSRYQMMAESIKKPKVVTQLNSFDYISSTSPTQNDIITQNTIKRKNFKMLTNQSIDQSNKNQTNTINVPSIKGHKHSKSSFNAEKYKELFGDRNNEYSQMDAMSRGGDSSMTSLSAKK